VAVASSKWTRLPLVYRILTRLQAPRLARESEKPAPRKASPIYEAVHCIIKRRDGGAAYPCRDDRQKLPLNRRQ
jgi:hypothetical protein